MSEGKSRTQKEADWKGKLEKRIRLQWEWPFFKFELGRWAYKTDCTGRTITYWWEGDR
jgi:hypothetical protein